MALLTSALAFAPAIVARSVTSPAGPVAFLSAPWKGWAFAGTVLRDSIRAELASPGEALTLAQRRWTGEGARSQATRVELIYLWQTRTFMVERPGADARVSTDGALAWLVIGRRSDGNDEEPVGVLGLRSGSFLWDVDDVGASLTTDTKPVATNPPAPSKDAA